MWREENNKVKRYCDNCGKEMEDGYCVDSGLEYYCSENCLRNNYMDIDIDTMYENEELYWTEWFEDE